MMSTGGNANRQRQRAEELCAALIRGFTGEAGIGYRGGRPHNGRRPLAIHAPHVHPDLDKDDFSSVRGAADSIALRVRHSDPSTHRQFCPPEPVARLIFEFLEQLRVETLAPRSMPGMRQNIRHRFIEWSRAFHNSGLTESSHGILLYTLFQICWSRLTGEAVPEATEGLMEATRASLSPLLGQDLAGIRHTCSDQLAFAQHARAIAQIVGRMIESAADEQDANEKQDEESTAAFKLLLNFDSGDEEVLALAPYGQSKMGNADEDGYRVFTAQYDCEVHAGSLVRKALLTELRERLDHRIAEHGIHIPRLARTLLALLAVPQRDGWSFGEEEGYIDGRRLAQVISSPGERRVFRLEQKKPIVNCAVTFLIDCSGSMKAHAEPVAIMIDILVRALDQIGVSTEVLGFTTRAWNGGKAHRDWMKAGRPENPGRLNELCHMIFKSADSNWRGARPHIAALLKADLYREGIDGEAVDWACARLRAHRAERRILVVVSDGCPTDSATALANDDFYLANHLKEVVARHELEGGVEICAIGVGLDLSPYYSRSLAVRLPESLKNDLFFDIAQLLCGARTSALRRTGT
jgi:cobaltochelatase CobT